MYIVYVLQSSFDGKRYVGYTSDIERRLKEHNAGKVKSTRNRRPFFLIYSEEVESKVKALKKERYFKSGFGRKYITKKFLGPIV